MEEVKSVETRFETMERVLHCYNSCGRPFQIRGRATEKRRSPSEVTIRGTLSISMLEVRRERTGLCACNTLFKYGKVPSFTALNHHITLTANLTHQMTANSS